MVIHMGSQFKISNMGSILLCIESAWIRIWWRPFLLFSRSMVIKSKGNFGWLL